MTKHKQAVPEPDRKISETILLFAAPLLQPHGGSQRRYEEVLQIAFTAWNAVVLADFLGDNYHLEQMRNLMSGKAEISSLIEELIERKREFFGDDPRMIGEYRVTKTEDGINLWAEARNPYSLTPRETKLGTGS